MNDPSRPRLIVDVGNTSIGAAEFAGSGQSGWWRTPLRHWNWRPHHEPPWHDWPDTPIDWVVASVNHRVRDELHSAVAERRPNDQWQEIVSSQFPIVTEVANKSAVGADRIAAAFAANRLREPDRGAVVIDAGSAINVEWIDPRGVFCGGAILPGMAMAARALSLDTELLPRVAPAHDPPRAVGRDTTEAIRSGLYWGAWGAIKELAAEFARGQSTPPHVMLTGGGLLWAELAHGMELHPHLVLSGIALAWHELPSP